MDISQQVHTALQQFNFANPSKLQFKPLSNSDGFSGALIFQVCDETSTRCLRRWPIETTNDRHRVDRLLWSHQILLALDEKIRANFPLPFLANNGSSLVELEGHLWQMENWIEGSSIPSSDWHSSHLKAAGKQLAQFHLSVAKEKRDNKKGGDSKSISDRMKFLRCLENGKLAKLQSAIESMNSEYSEIARHLCRAFHRLAPGVTLELSQLLNHELPQSVVHGDCRSDHFHFLDHRLVGCVDMGSIRKDTPAADLGRLIADQENLDNSTIDQLLSSYLSIQQLTTIERKSIRIIAELTILLSGLMWLDWIFLQGKNFQSTTKIKERLAFWLRQVNRLVEIAEKNEDIWSLLY